MKNNNCWVKSHFAYLKSNDDNPEKESNARKKDSECTIIKLRSEGSEPNRIDDIEYLNDNDEDVTHLEVLQAIHSFSDVTRTESDTENVPRMIIRNSRPSIGPHCSVEVFPVLQTTRGESSVEPTNTSGAKDALAHRPCRPLKGNLANRVPSECFTKNNSEHHCKGSLCRIIYEYSSAPVNCEDCVQKINEIRSVTPTASNDLLIGTYLKSANNLGKIILEYDYATDCRSCDKYNVFDKDFNNANDDELDEFKILLESSFKFSTITVWKNVLNPTVYMNEQYQSGWNHQRSYHADTNYPHCPDCRKEYCAPMAPYNTARESRVCPPYVYKTAPLNMSQITRLKRGVLTPARQPCEGFSASSLPKQRLTSDANLTRVRQEIQQRIKTGTQVGKPKAFRQGVSAYYGGSSVKFATEEYSIKPPERLTSKIKQYTAEKEKPLTTVSPNLFKLSPPLPRILQPEIKSSKPYKHLDETLIRSLMVEDIKNRLSAPYKDIKKRLSAPCKDIKNRLSAPYKGIKCKPFKIINHNNADKRNAFLKDIKTTIVRLTPNKIVYEFKSSIHDVESNMDTATSDASDTQMKRYSFGDDDFEKIRKILCCGTPHSDKFPKMHYFNTNQTKQRDVAGSEYNLDEKTITEGSTNKEEQNLSKKGSFNIREILGNSFFDGDFDTKNAHFATVIEDDSKDNLICKRSLFIHINETKSKNDHFMSMSTIEITKTTRMSPNATDTTESNGETEDVLIENSQMSVNKSIEIKNENYTISSEIDDDNYNSNTSKENERMKYVELRPSRFVPNLEALIAAKINQRLDQLNIVECKMNVKNIKMADVAASVDLEKSEVSTLLTTRDNQTNCSSIILKVLSRKSSNHKTHRDESRDSHFNGTELSKESKGCLAVCISKQSDASPKGVCETLWRHRRVYKKKSLLAKCYAVPTTLPIVFNRTELLDELLSTVGIQMHAFAKKSHQTVSISISSHVIKYSIVPPTEIPLISIESSNSIQIVIHEQEYIPHVETLCFINRLVTLKGDRVLDQSLRTAEDTFNNSLLTNYAKTNINTTCPPKGNGVFTEFYRKPSNDGAICYEPKGKQSKANTNACVRSTIWKYASALLLRSHSKKNVQAKTKTKLDLNDGRKSKAYGFLSNQSVLCVTALKCDQLPLGTRLESALTDLPLCPPRREQIHYNRALSNDGSLSENNPPIDMEESAISAITMMKSPLRHCCYKNSDTYNIKQIQTKQKKCISSGPSSSKNKYPRVISTPLLMDYKCKRTHRNTITGKKDKSKLINMIFDSFSQEYHMPDTITYEDTVENVDKSIRHGYPGYTNPSTENSIQSTFNTPSAVLQVNRPERMYDVFQTVNTCHSLQQVGKEKNWKYDSDEMQSSRKVIKCNDINDSLNSPQSWKKFEVRRSTKCCSSVNTGQGSDRFSFASISLKGRIFNKFAFKGCKSDNKDLPTERKAAYGSNGGSYNRKYVPCEKEVGQKCTMKTPEDHTNDEVSRRNQSPNKISKNRTCPNRRNFDDGYLRSRKFEGKYSPKKCNLQPDQEPSCSSINRNKIHSIMNVSTGTEHTLNRNASKELKSSYDDCTHQIERRNSAEETQKHQGLGSEYCTCKSSEKDCAGFSHKKKSKGKEKSPKSSERLRKNYPCLTGKDFEGIADCYDVAKVCVEKCPSKGSFDGNIHRKVSKDKTKKCFSKYYPCLKDDEQAEEITNCYEFAAKCAEKCQRSSKSKQEPTSKHCIGNKNKKKSRTTNKESCASKCSSSDSFNVNPKRQPFKNDASKPLDFPCFNEDNLANPDECSNDSNICDSRQMTATTKSISCKNTNHVNKKFPCLPNEEIENIDECYEVSKLCASKCSLSDLCRSGNKKKTSKMHMKLKNKFPCMDENDLANIKECTDFAKLCALKCMSRSLKPNRKQSTSCKYRKRCSYNHTCLYGVAELCASKCSSSDTILVKKKRKGAHNSYSDEDDLKTNNESLVSKKNNLECVSHSSKTNAKKTTSCKHRNQKNKKWPCLSNQDIENLDDCYDVAKLCASNCSSNDSCNHKHKKSSKNENKKLLQQFQCLNEDDLGDIKECTDVPKLCALKCRRKSAKWNSKQSSSCKNKCGMNTKFPCLTNAEIENPDDCLDFDYLANIKERTDVSKICASKSQKPQNDSGQRRLNRNQTCSELTEEYEACEDINDGSNDYDYWHKRRPFAEEDDANLQSFSESEDLSDKLKYVRSIEICANRHCSIRKILTNMFNKHKGENVSSDESYQSRRKSNKYSRRGMVTACQQDKKNTRDDVTTTQCQNSSSYLLRANCKGISVIKLPSSDPCQNTNSTLRSCKNRPFKKYHTPKDSIATTCANLHRDSFDALSNINEKYTKETFSTSNGKSSTAPICNPSVKCNDNECSSPDTESVECSPHCVIGESSNQFNKSDGDYRNGDPSKQPVKFKGLRRFFMERAGILFGHNGGSRCHVNKAVQPEQYRQHNSDREEWLPIDICSPVRPSSCVEELVARPEICNTFEARSRTRTTDGRKCRVYPRETANPKPRTRFPLVIPADNEKYIHKSESYNHECFQKPYNESYPEDCPTVNANSTINNYSDVTSQNQIRERFEIGNQGSKTTPVRLSLNKNYEPFAKRKNVSYEIGNSERPTTRCFNMPKTYANEISRDEHPSKSSNYQTRSRDENNTNAPNPATPQYSQHGAAINASHKDANGAESLSSTNKLQRMKTSNGRLLRLRNEEVSPIGAKSRLRCDQLRQVCGRVCVTRTRRIPRGNPISDRVSSVPSRSESRVMCRDRKRYSDDKDTRKTSDLIMCLACDKQSCRVFGNGHQRESAENDGRAGVYNKFVSNDGEDEIQSTPMHECVRPLNGDSFCRVPLSDDCLGSGADSHSLSYLSSYASRCDDDSYNINHDCESAVPKWRSLRDVRHSEARCTNDTLLLFQDQKYTEFVGSSDSRVRSDSHESDKTADHDVTVNDLVNQNELAKEPNTTKIINDTTDTEREMLHFLDDLKLTDNIKIVLKSRNGTFCI